MEKELEPILLAMEDTDDHDLVRKAARIRSLMKPDASLRAALDEHLKDLEKIWYEEAEKIGKPMKDLCCDYESLVGIIRETCVQRDAIHTQHDGTGELCAALSDAEKWIISLANGNSDKLRDIVEKSPRMKKIRSLLSRYQQATSLAQRQWQGSNQQSA